MPEEIASNSSPNAPPPLEDPQVSVASPEAVKVIRAKKQSSKGRKTAAAASQLT